MISLLPRIIPQWVINIFWHLPIAIFANIIYSFPSRKLTVIGVTGTDGKTTTVNMIYQILKDAGKKVSMVSTINAVVGGKKLDTGFHVTSPHPLTIQKFLKDASSSGSQYIVTEVTSHALDQHRFFGINFDIGVITNITHEHLDYHGSWENYFNAKAKLIKNVRIAVLNRDERHYPQLTSKTHGEVVSFGLTKQADFNPIKFPIKMQLPGDFNILNALAAVAVAVNLRINSKVIRSTLKNFQVLKGRMDEVENSLGIKIVIDFAHTPNALKKALTYLRKKTSGQLIAVFGSAGKRDQDKRALMGKIAAEVSDQVIITAEDPRGELKKINQQIFKGAKGAGAIYGKNIFIEEDRQQAISLAINTLAKKGDSVGIFGKGHETSINLDGKHEQPWSDHQAVVRALKKRSDG